MAITVGRIQQIMFDHECHGSSIPKQDYKASAMHIMEDLPHMEDSFQLEELLYDLCSRLGSEDYEQVAVQIWEEFIEEEYC